MLDRRLGQDAVAEIEDVGPVSQIPRARDRRLHRVPAPPATSASGSRLPCSATASRQSLDRRAGLDRGVEADRGDARHMRRIFASCVAAPRGKAMIGAFGRACADLGDHGGDRRHAPALELGRRQDARPGIENLHSFRARCELAQEIGGRSVDEALDQLGEQLRLAIGEEPRRRLIGRAAPGDHVARDRPGRAAKADQRDVAGQRRFDPLERLECRARAASSRARRRAWRGRRRRRSDRGAGLRRSRTRPSARARRGSPECRKRGSPRRSRSGGSAAASPRPRRPAYSRNRGSSPPGRGSRDTPADSVPPAA